MRSFHTSCSNCPPDEPYKLEVSFASVQGVQCAATAQNRFWINFFRIIEYLPATNDHCLLFGNIDIKPSAPHCVVCRNILSLLVLLMKTALLAGFTCACSTPVNNDVAVTSWFPLVSYVNYLRLNIKRRQSKNITADKPVIRPAAWCNPHWNCSTKWKFIANLQRVPDSTGPRFRGGIVVSWRFAYRAWLSSKVLGLVDGLWLINSPDVDCRADD